MIKRKLMENMENMENIENIENMDITICNKYI